MSNVLIQMFRSEPFIGKIANEIANKSVREVVSKAKDKSKSKLFSKYISIHKLFLKQIEVKKCSFSKFIVDEYSRLTI